MWEFTEKESLIVGRRNAFEKKEIPFHNARSASTLLRRLSLPEVVFDTYDVTSDKKREVGRDPSHMIGIVEDSKVSWGKELWPQTHLYDCHFSQYQKGFDSDEVFEAQRKP